IQGGPSTTTDASGTYVIFSASSGLNLIVSASKAGFTTSTLSTVNIAAGNLTLQDFSLRQLQSTGTLSGRVTNASGGAAIAGATVTISGGGSAATDASGNYTISSVTPGTGLNVTASKSGFSSSTVSTVTVTPGTTTTQNFALTALPTTGTLSGKVTNASGGAAIAGATVTISAGGAATTDGNGNFLFSSLGAGNYTVVASAGGFTTSPAATVSVSAGNSTTQNFALTPTASGSVPGAPWLVVTNS